MRDPYAGHRHSETDVIDGRAEDWTGWDFAIGTAMQIIEDSTTDHGHLIWEIEADDVDAQAYKRIDKAQAAIDRITQNEKYKAQPGEAWITKLIHPYHNPDDPESPEPVWQTRQEWLRKKIEEI